MHRKTFLKAGALALAGSGLLRDNLFAAAKPTQLLGVQLYSVRDDMNTDPQGTLKQLAAIGYKNVEHAGYAGRKFYGSSPDEFKKILSGLGMKMPSGHTVFRKEHWDEGKKDFTDEWKATVEDAAIVGQQFVISPWLDESLRKSMDDMKKMMELFNRCGELCKKSGMKFGYHNHDFEFNTRVNDKKIYDIIMENTDPSLVAQQLDIGNMYGGGGRAEEVLKQYPGRFESMHVKDEIKAAKEGAEAYESTVLGKGIIPVKEVLDLAKKSGGTLHFIIEQESYQGLTPMQTVKEDYEQMKKWGF